MGKINKVPDLKGIKIEKAEEILKESNIKYNEDYIYKASVFRRNGIVIKTDPQEGEEYNENKKLDIYVSRFIPVPLLLLLFFLFALAALFFNIGSNRLEYKEYRSPQITAEKEGWVPSNIVYVTKEANLENIEYYEYCIREDENKKACEWKRTDTKSVEISVVGIWNVWFRAVDGEGHHSPVSNKVTVQIDNEGPEVSGEIEVYENRRK